MTDWFNEPRWSAHQIIWWICRRDPEFQGYEQRGASLGLELKLAGFDDAFDAEAARAIKKQSRGAPSRGFTFKAPLADQDPPECEKPVQVNTVEPDSEVERAKTDLLQKLQRDKIRCTGIGLRSNERKTVAAGDWEDLDLVDDFKVGEVTAKGTKRIPPDGWVDMVFTSLSFRREDVLMIWPKDEATSRKGQGRPHGPQYNDDHLLELMREGIIDGTFLSRWAAAQAFAEQAEGGGTRNSKAKRLSKRYSAKFGD